MSDTVSGNPAEPTPAIGNNASTGAAPGGGGTGGTSVGVSTTGVTAPTNPLVLPPNYASSGNEFYTRQSEPVPTSITTGPDGALYVSNLGAIPYPKGYAYITRVADPTSTTGFDGQIPSGTAQTFASGLTEVQSLSFDAQGNLYALEYLNANGIYSPTAPADLPPSRLIRIGTDGVRTTISGDELKLANYVKVDQATGDIYAAINNADTTNGQVIRYRVGADGTATNEVVASGLNNPRGMSFGPDGNLYVLEQGVGTPAGDPNAANAPSIVFLPGAVSERGGYTGSITKLDISGAEVSQERIFTGLASFREYNPVTGQDRVISIGPNGIAIDKDGTAWVASGGGLAPATADSIAPFSDLTRGLIRVDGLFDGNSQDATLTPVFDSVKYGSERGPDGATTLFNTQSNLNDVTIGADGNLYAIDAARNVVYGLGTDGDAVDSATVIPKQPPVLTPGQFAQQLSRGGNPAADYAVEIDQRTTKNSNGLPDTPGRAAAPTPPVTAPASSSTPFGPPPTGANPAGPPPAGVTSADTTASANAPSAGTSATGTSSGTPPVGTQSRGEDANVAAANSATGGPPSGTNAATDAGVPGAIPVDPNFGGPSDPTSPPVTPGNIYTPYFNPFFGYASDERLALDDGRGGTYTASNLYSFGDRLADDGGTFGIVPFLEGNGTPTPYTTAPYNSSGSLSDGPKWTTSLSQILGVAQSDRDTNFAYESATTQRVGGDPADPFQTAYNFEGQIGIFEAINGRFQSDDLVTVTFGANDITVPGVQPTPELVDLTVDAIIGGLQDLADLGARHFLVTNIPDITLAPLFGDPAIGGALGIDGSIYPALVDRFNARLDTAVENFENRTDLDVNVLDLNKLFDAIADDPSAYGFTNVEESVLVSLPFPGTQPVYNPDIVGQDPVVQHSTLFLDPFFNPTALGQSIIAESARSALT